MKAFKNMRKTQSQKSNNLKEKRKHQHSSLNSKKGFKDKLEDNINEGFENTAGVKKEQKVNRRHSSKQSFSNIRTALILVTIALAITVNAVAYIAVNRYSWKIDLTDTKLYQLTKTTHRTVELLTSPMSITVFSDRDEYPVMLKEILAKYDSLSNLINVSYHDPFSNPLLVDTYEQQGTRIAQNDLIIAVKDSYKHLSINDLYTFNSDGTAVTSVRAEQKITGSLVGLLGTGSSTAVFTNGHNERPSEALKTLFEQNSYEIDTISLTITKPKDNTDILVIASPSRDFTADEIKRIESYLLSGGSLMVFLPPSKAELSNLSDFLNAWGITFGDAVVFEPRAHISDNQINIVPMYAQHEINTYFGDNKYFLMMPSSRIMRPVSDRSYDLKVMTALASTSDSYAKSYEVLQTESSPNQFSSLLNTDQSSTEAQRIDKYLQGPFHLALTAEKPVFSRASSSGSEEESKNDKISDARIFAVGSEKMFADDILEMSSFANADFLIQTINWLNPEQHSINIPAKGLAPPPLNILPSEAETIGIILSGVIPFIIIATGFAILIKRKRS